MPENKTYLSMTKPVTTYTHKLRAQIEKHESCMSFLLLRMTARVLKHAKYS